MPGIDLGITVTALNNASNSLNNVSNDVKKVGDNAQATANRLKAIQVVIAGILIEKTLEWGKALVVAAAATQNLDLRMANMAGGAANAHKVWSGLAEEFAATPFKMDAIADAWTRLRSTVGSNDGTTKIIEAIVTDVGALGGKDENINNLAESFQRLFATGIASAREYKSILQQTGLTLGDLAKAAGDSQEAFAMSLKNGFMKASTFVDAFIKASQDRFGFFTQNLKNSVGGSMNLIENTISKGMSDLGSRTNINEHLTVFFQNLAGAIDKVMASISQKDIDHFFDWLKKIEPLIIMVVQDLINVGVAVLDVGTSIATLLGHMPAEAIELGMIGYFLFGKKGAAVLAMLGYVSHNLPSTVAGAAGSFTDLENKTANRPGGAYQALLDYNNKQNPGSPISNMFTSMAQYGGGKAYQWMHGAGDASKPAIDAAGDMWTKAFGSGPQGNGASMFGSQADIDKAKKALEDLMKSFKGGANPTGTDANANLALAMEQAAAMTTKLQDALAGVKDKLDEINDSTSGDELGGNLDKLRIQGDAIQKQIDAQINAEGTLKIHTAANLALVEKLRQEKELTTKAIDAAIAKEKIIYALQQQQFVVQQKLVQMQNAFATQQLGIDSNQSVGFNIALGSDAGQAILANMQQQQQYSAQIVQYDQQALALQEQIAALGDAASSAPQRDALAASLGSINRLNDATKKAMSSLSVEGKMQQQLWQNLGSTLQNDIADGLAGVLTGTQTLGDVARKVFTDMISMAIKYLIQLLAIKAIGLFFGDGGAIPGGVQPFANGGIPQPGGNVKAFANGDILTGPTLFGLAGEAGDEAIMPLTRIGGKLGVKSAGGDGGANHYHLNIYANDTQSGMQFVSKHIDDIDQQLEHRRRLNRSVRPK